MHELIPRDEERIIEISDTRRRMDYCERSVEIFWWEAEFRSLLSLPLLFLGECLVVEKIGV